MDDFERLTRKRFDDMLASKGYSHVKVWANEMGVEAAFDHFIGQPYFAYMWQRLRTKAARRAASVVVPLENARERKIV